MTFLAPLAITAAALTPMIFVQPALARTVHGVKETRDVSVLPPASELRALSLGYRDAAVDLLWSSLLVQYGTHWQEHRLFPAAPLYLDGLLALDPKYRPVFNFADTLLFYHPGGTPNAADVALAQKYMKIGLETLPNDGQLWMKYGQFTAFIAISVEPDDQRAPMRAEGARAMARGVENGAEASRILSVASMLDESGARAAALDGLERTYALTDDPTTRKQIADRIAQLRGSAQRDEAQRQIKAVEAHWRTDFDFLTRGQYLLMAPMPSVPWCAGLSHADAPECAYDWPAALEEPTP